MIDGWFSVLVISLIVAFGGLVALLVESCRGESLRHIEGPYLLPRQYDHHRRARITSVLHKDCMSHIPTSAAIEDASVARRELLDSINRQCGMAPNPGEQLRIRALDNGAIRR